MSVLQCCELESQTQSWQKGINQNQSQLNPECAARRMEELTCRAGCLPLAHSPRPLESDFLSSVSLAVILLLVFISVSPILVSSSAKPLPLTACWTTGACHRIASLAHLQFLFPSQSETLWRSLDLSLRNQWQLSSLSGRLRILLAAVALGESRNTLLCLSRNLVSQLSVMDQIPLSTVRSKLLDFSPSDLYGASSLEVVSHVLSVSVVFMRQGHAAYGINVALYSSLAGSPAAWRTMLSLSPSNMDTLEESWLQNVTSSIVFDLLESIVKNRKVPESAWVTGMNHLPILSIKPEPALEKGFVC
ncbi:uncharacterized protein LOC115473068 [Microcaecilia unicolor]|uniref:Uncharacterized protein LOC115473068 n=1 Tax=Microcaecilia unicolor TaxID=1415580 RepID=A0A6P7Y7Q9_9AMPH|nr:uncharacterized protein LOC115473068 [Microcaecilia unicolor]XP_030063562.1 uncharacterized protein LOC115473068 [Microcaecilia unicolor]XP_030063563.1 uncharacterized protein LOC115473068 [Microcaecilia unicolor]